MRYCTRNSPLPTNLRSVPGEGPGVRVEEVVSGQWLVASERQDNNVAETLSPSPRPQSWGVFWCDIVFPTINSGRRAGDR